MAGSIYDGLLFFPERALASVPERIADIIREDVDFTSKNGKRLHGWYFNNPGSNKVALCSDGNAGNISYRVPLIDILLQCHVSVLIYDYQGYGLSEGKPSLDGICEDGVAAYDFLAEKRKQADTMVVLLGESLGTGVACQIARQRKVDGIILTSPFSSMLHLGRSIYPIFKLFPNFLLPKQHLDNIAVLSKPHAPLLILHGERDEIIPMSEAERLFAGASEPKRFVRLPRAGHNDIYDGSRAEYQAAVQEFLSSL
jgi:pimeloyl-ACP methyl ester carboxylesterase